MHVLDPELTKWLRKNNMLACASYSAYYVRIITEVDELPHTSFKKPIHALTDVTCIVPEIMKLSRLFREGQTITLSSQPKAFLTIS